MKYRKLRIAWSVAWGILCIAIVAMWVRSFAYYEAVYLSPRTSIGLLMGSCIFGEQEYPVSPFHHFSHHDVSELDWEGIHETLNNGTIFQLGNLLRVTNYNNGKGISVHFGLIAAFLTGACVAPWVRWRFSLRTLLIGMTVAAVGLGSIVYALRK